MTRQTYHTALFICWVTILFVTPIRAQVGISVTPPRVYYTANPGQTEVKEILITNVSKEHTMELAITLGDWVYNEIGENIFYPADSLANSLAAWVSLPQAYISLKPNESHTLRVGLTVPPSINPQAVHTAMLYVTQMNAVDDINEQGATIKVNVRSGIKLFQRSSVPRTPQVNITDLAVDRSSNSLWLAFQNTGNVWIDGKVSAYLFHKNTGKEIELSETLFYTMPDDFRKLRVTLPPDLEKGAYTATLMMDYGDANQVEAAEIDFNHE